MPALTWVWPTRMVVLGARKGTQMPKRLTVSATLLALTLLLAIANVGSAATASGRQAAARRAAQQPMATDAANDVFAINDGFVTKTWSHLGNPANGILTAETWGETGWMDAGDNSVVPNNSQGVVRALKQAKVLRVAVRVELWGADDPSSERLLASSSSVNSGTASSALVKTPEVDVRTAPCLLWTRAFVVVRWSDNRLSSLSFEMPVGYFNQDAHCLG
jgi:hypothetical protein